MTGIRRRRSSDRGASAVEYGLLIAAIAGVIIAIVFGLGEVIGGVFSDSCNGIGTAATQSTTRCG
jgi:pilus assembly protein Flp/PilA